MGIKVSWTAAFIPLYYNGSQYLSWVLYKKAKDKVCNYIKKSCDAKIIFSEGDDILFKGKFGLDDLEKMKKYTPKRAEEWLALLDMEIHFERSCFQWNWQKWKKIQ